MTSADLESPIIMMRALQSDVVFELWESERVRERDSGGYVCVRVCVCVCVKRLSPRDRDQ